MGSVKSHVVTENAEIGEGLDIVTEIGNVIPNVNSLTDVVPADNVTVERRIALTGIVAE
jgi:hypothetical protein